MSVNTVILSLRRSLNAPLFVRARGLGRELFSKYLLFTNIGLSAGFSFTGDLLVQRYEIAKGRQNKWDPVRSAQVTASGAVVGVVCHYWYNFLDSRFPGRSFRSVVSKVVIDQFVCSPLYISAFFATTCYLEGKTLPEFGTEWRQKGWQLYVADCIVWPPAQLFNFYILPLRFRVLFDNTVSLGFDVYTSYVKYQVPLEES